MQEVYQSGLLRTMSVEGKGGGRMVEREVSCDAVSMECLSQWDRKI